MKLHMTQVAAVDSIKTGAAVRAERKKAGKTLIKVAKAMRISEPYLSGLERGRHPWTLAMLKRFERAL